MYYLTLVYICNHLSMRHVKLITLPSSTKLSVQAGLIPLISENSNCCPFKTQITPLVWFSATVLLVKNILYCVLSGITIESNSDALDKLSLNIDCTLELIVPNSTSPILAVPAIVRNPSGPKKY